MTATSTFGVPLGAITLITKISFGLIVISPLTFSLLACELAPIKVVNIRDPPLTPKASETFTVEAGLATSTTLSVGYDAKF